MIEAILFLWNIVMSIIFVAWCIIIYVAFPVVAFFFAKTVWELSLPVIRDLLEQI